ncbi:predicted protein [Postia placenta Mad-698-R]|nr:predicted protein [Postia placenta Mad-698-R]
MKIVTKEEQDAQMRATIVGGAKGFAGGLAVALPLSYLLNRRVQHYRHLPPSLKAFGVILIAVPSFVINAEHAGLNYEKQNWHASSYSAARHEYGFIGGAWAATMVGAFGYIMRNPYQTLPQKVVQARMWAQGLTIGVLIAAGALTHARKAKEVDEFGHRHIEPDHSWRDIVAQEEKHLKEQQPNKSI